MEPENSNSQENLNSQKDQIQKNIYIYQNNNYNFNMMTKNNYNKQPNLNFRSQRLNMQQLIELIMRMKLQAQIKEFQLLQLLKE